MAGGQHDQDRVSSEDVSPTRTFDAAYLTSTRQPYQRESSWSSPSQDQACQAPVQEYDLVEPWTQDGKSAHGLGLTDIPERTHRIRRVPVGSKDNLKLATSLVTAGTPSGSVETRGVYGQATTANDTRASMLNSQNTNIKWPSTQSLRNSLTDTGMHYIPTNGPLLDYSLNEHYSGGCPTDGDVLKARMNWFTTTIVILVVYSTAFSAIFLVIALAKPRWGHKIGTQGNLSFSGATLLSALFSKTVELSFVTVFVATLGQMLSRRAFVNDSISKARGGGISIAQMNMRLWIMQPGTLITNWIGVKYALPTVLGVVTLIAAVSAIFYTTAAEALVSPKLKMGKYERRELAGKVSASYANSGYMSDNCQTPIPTDMETVPGYRGDTCLQIKHAGQGFNNFDFWITQWAQKIENADVGPTSSRLAPLATWHNNTLVYGQWITPSGENITADSERWGRLIQNVTMVIPHSNLFNAVLDPVNQILQPDDLQGAGEYVVKAAIPAPAVNVICAGLSGIELAPMITNNDTNEVSQRVFTTALDDIFGWQPEGSGAGEVAPWFTKAPEEYNTLGNFTKIWGQSAIYILAKPPKDIETNEYVLCSMRSMQYPNCTTSYHVVESGGELSVYCDSDLGNVLPYSEFVPTAPIGNIEKNWKDVAVEWVEAVALTHGDTDGDAAIARMLTQTIPSYNNQTFARLRAGLPSYGESLAVLAGCTLLLSSTDAPFKHEWTLSDGPYFLDEPQYEHFQAMVAYKDYASGGSQKYQGIFYVVLLSTFVLNCWCLSYLIWNFWYYGHVTDYTEPQNLFALAINSPPSNMLAGACGGGPDGNMLGKKWCVNMSLQQSPSTAMRDHSGAGMTTATENLHPHFYLRSTDDHIDISTTPNVDSSMSWANTPVETSEQSRFLTLRSPRFGTDVVKDMLLSSRSKVSRQPHQAKVRARGEVSKFRSMDSLGVDESPAVEQYLKLIGKR